MPTAVRQLAAVTLVAAIGAAGLVVTENGRTGEARPAAVVVSPPAPVRHSDARPLPAVAARAKPRPKPAAAPVHHAAPAARKAAPAKPVKWMPTGVGMWIYEWKKSGRGNARAVISRARSHGLSHLFVRTGSTHDGYAGTGVLHALLPATAGTGIKVIAWDFPELKHPARDARRLARAAWDGRHGNAPHVAAVAPDIETHAEGTRSTSRRVKVYLHTLRHYLPSDVAILTTVPWPSTARVGRYPYGSVAASSDAILPMAYWYDNSPREVTARSIAFLRNYHRPVMPVGQGYDGKLDVPWLRHNNLRRQVPAFFVTARRMGAPAVSLWSWQAAPPVAWKALSRARSWFPPHNKH